MTAPAQDHPTLLPRQAPTSNNGAITQTNPLSELGFELMWPDSEYLFQTIMSPNPLAFQSEPTPLSEFSVGTPSSAFDERVPSIDSIPSGGNHKAVHDVSQMVARWVSPLILLEELDLTEVIVFQHYRSCRVEFHPFCLPGRMLAHVFRAFHSNVPRPA
jgi:hypothetical protein